MNQSELLISCIYNNKTSEASKIIQNMDLQMLENTKYDLLYECLNYGNVDLLLQLINKGMRSGFAIEKAIQLSYNSIFKIMLDKWGYTQSMDYYAKIYNNSVVVEILKEHKI